MLRGKTWALTIGVWMAVTFTICVLGGVLAPSLPIPHRTLELLLPGFTWISIGSYFLGLAETFVYGLYVGWSIVVLHNFFNRPARASGRSLLNAD